MFDATLYESAHGADGYVRVNSDAHATCSVLYKLQRARLAHRFQRSAVPQSSRL
ncbi:unnamed protein product [Gongylonema pulchrum]|uniref:Transposase n=1 Tax=Gongylonema pulchrum TaxID=637853 RepID=A0A183CVQ9_9BILA|nr:unnamed protein product [Gongylonema pulchrum]